MRPSLVRLRLSALLLTALTAAAFGEALATDAKTNPPAEPQAPAKGERTTARGELHVIGAAEAKPMVQAPYLGLATEPLPLSRCAELGLPAGTGLSVVMTDRGEPAAKAGLLPRDVLVKLDDQILVNPSQLRVLVRLRKPGEPLVFEVLRNGQKMQVKAEPTPRLVPELTPGGEESRFIYANPGKTAASVRTFRIAPGEQPIPPEVLKDMPPELREQIEAMNKAGQAEIRGGSVTASAAADGAEPVISSRAFTQDNLHAFEVEHGKRERLRVTERQGGKVLYDGPIPADAKGWEQIPADVRAKAKALSQHRVIQLKASVDLQPKPDAKSDAAPGK